MKTPKLLSLPVAICFAMVLQTHAQNQNPSQELASYAGEYVARVGGNSALFTGRMQSSLPGGIESLYLRQRGHVEQAGRASGDVLPQPVSPVLSYAVGDLFYDGVLYTGVRMRLDLCRDEMAAAPASDFPVGVVLDPYRFEYADLRGYRIIYFGELSGYDIPRGYYLQLHEGRYDVLKKEVFAYSPSDFKFSRNSLRFYIEKDGVYHRVGQSKGQILRLFRDRRSELNAFIRSNGIKIWNDPEKALVDIVSEYERLTER